MKRKLLLFAIAGTVHIASPAITWEATRPLGPIDPNERVTGTTRSGAPAANLATPLSRQTIQYPYETGVRLGDGWDFLSGKRVYSQCIQFGTSFKDSYQQAEMRFDQAEDNETLSVALNISTSASANGSIGIFSGSASGSFNLDTSYKFTSQDQLVVAKASVVNGSTFVTAQSAQPESRNGTDKSNIQPATAPAVAGITLSAAAVKIAKDPVAFRAACGDGFVASIATGADLYVLYHFTHADRQTRIDIANSLKAGGSVGGVFGANGSFSTRLQIDNRITNDRLGIHFIQNGGKIAALPVSKDDVEKRVKALTAEAFDNGRPIFMVVVPYSELSNWPQNIKSPKYLDDKTAAARYFQRLTSIYFELQSAIADFQRDGALAGPITDNAYVHDVRLRLRAISYSQLNSELLDEIDAVSRVLATLNDCPNGRATHDCRKALDTLPPLDYDDYRYWIQLPLPAGALSGSTLAYLTAAGNEDQRKFRYSMALYQHWVERIAMARCTLFFECLTSEKRRKEYGLIASSLGLRTASVSAAIFGSPLQKSDYARVGFSVVGREAADLYRQKCEKAVGPTAPAAGLEFCESQPAF
jgi:hypothetical protein